MSINSLPSILNIDLTGRTQCTPLIYICDGSLKDANETKYETLTLKKKGDILQDNKISSEVLL